MEELKTKVKDLVPEDKHVEVDKVFQDWIVGLKVHTISDKEDPEEYKELENETNVKKNLKEDPALGAPSLEAPSLKAEIEELKKKIMVFKEKMKIYKQSETSTTDLALADVKKEIGRVRDGILKLKSQILKPEEFDKNSGNAELIKKLDEVKEFLERLK